MTGPGTAARARERVAGITRGTGDSRTLRLRLLDEIRRGVGFDAYAWVLTDPQTCVGSAPLADVPCLPELPALIRLKYLTTVNRWTAMTGPVALLQEATGGDPSRSLIWRKMLSRYGIVDVASMVFRDRFGVWGFLDLWRAGSGSGFAPAETAFLTDIAGAVTRGLRQCQADTFAVRPRPDRRRIGPVVLLLSAGLDVVAQTPETEEFLAAIVPPVGDRPPIPASAYNVAAQLLAAEAGIDANPPTTRLHLSDGQWVTLRAARIGDPAAPEQGIAVTIEETSPHERMTLFASAFGLTPRETDVLGHLCEGIDTRDLAGRMFLSEHTVQDHLKSIFTKTSTRTRPALLSRALGT